MIKWNKKNGIHVFRLSSEMFPHISNPELFKFDEAGIDKLGNKIELRTKKPVPQSIRKQIQNERIKKGLLSPGQIKLAKRFAADEKKPVYKMHVKSIAEAKKLAAKILKVGGGSRNGPITQIQEKLLIKRKRLK